MLTVCCRVIIIFELLVLLIFLYKVRFFNFFSIYVFLLKLFFFILNSHNFARLNFVHFDWITAQQMVCIFLISEYAKILVMYVLENVIFSFFLYLFM